jgi:hypothetical protein
MFELWMQRITMMTLVVVGMLLTAAIVLKSESLLYIGLGTAVLGIITVFAMLVYSEYIELAKKSQN